MSRYKLSSVFLTILLALPFQVWSQTEKPMTNQDVIRLAKLGLAADIIVTKINGSSANFDLTVEGLATLSQNRVPNDVIKIMQAKTASQPRTVTVPAGGHHAGGSGNGGGASADAGSRRPSSYPLPPDKGAYLWDATKLRLLYQSTVPSIGQNFWRSITPFVRKKFELQLVEPFAKVRFDISMPTILVSGLGEVIPGVPAYRLLYVKTGGMLKDRRIVGVYSVGGFFGSIRLMDNEVECEIKKVAEGVYAITPLKPLKDGEYGLVQVPKLADMSSRPSFAPPIWDFGVYAEGHPSEKKD